MHSRAEALLLLLLKLVVSVLEMASDKRKAKKMLKFKENDIAASCITGRKYLVTSIRENKCGQRVIELEGHKCNIVRDIRTDENGEEYILDEVKLTGGVVEEVRIVPIVTVAIGALYVMAGVKAFQFIKKKLGKSEDEDAREYNQRRDVLYIYIPKRGYIRDLNHDCTELLYTDKEHEAKVFMYIDGIRGVLSYMKLVKNAGVTLPDYYIVTNGVKEQVAKIHF
jgi:hypothetical protein